MALNKRRYADATAETLRILMQLANLVDERGAEKETKSVTIDLSEDLGLGYRAFSRYIRDGIYVLTELQDKVYDLQEKNRWLRISRDARPDIEGLSDEHQKEVLDLAEKLRAQEDAEYEEKGEEEE